MSKDQLWLDPWAPMLQNKRVLELGCGSGVDTLTISALVETLVACDIAPRAARVGSQIITKLDHSKNLPFDIKDFDVVVASLCLHYFMWTTTQSIVNNISKVLRDDGLLICRLNSENDTNYGSKGYSEIEAGLYSVDGQQKRFFSKTDIEDLFPQPWRLLNLKEASIDRYKREKIVWEFGAINGYHAQCIYPKG